MADLETSISKSVVEYMAPLNEQSTVQLILGTSLAASPEAGQQYKFVVFGLAMDSFVRFVPLVHKTFLPLRI